MSWDPGPVDEFCVHHDTHEGFPPLPHNEDGYCCWCGNGSWRLHAPWCTWQDHADAKRRTPAGHSPAAHGVDR